MRSLPHRVRRQRWLVRVGSSRAAFGVRKRLRDDWQHLLLPAFEKSFDRIASDEEIIRIPKIELRLKVASEEKLTELLPELIDKEVTEQLRELFRKQPEEKPVLWRQSTVRQTRFEALLRYLRTGSVDWEAASKAAANLADHFRETCRDQLEELLAIAHAELPSAEFYFRLLQLLPLTEASELPRVLVETVAHSWNAPLLEIVSRLLEPEQKYFSRYTQLHFAALILSEALARHASDTVPEFVAIAKRALPLESKSLENFISTLSDSVTAMLRLGEPNRCAAIPASSILEAGVRTAPPIHDKPKAKRVLKGQAGIQSNEELPEGTLEATSHLGTTPETVDDFALTVTHAGLILLHPFLPRFLESTAVKEKAQASLSPIVLPHAAALLHFLATGEEEILEYDLAFVKILLGLEPETPLCVSEGLIGGGDKTEAETLLQSVIDHWMALKKTSVAGLRCSFLKRQALLRETETGWKLQVERQPFDVLLEYLPWSISVVKLPWMTRAIHTDW
jgi:hypothetical protein